MKCRHCYVALPPSRILVDGEFCCDAHRVAYEQAIASEQPEFAEPEQISDAEVQPEAAYEAEAEPAVEEEPAAYEEDPAEPQLDFPGEIAKSWQWLTSAWRRAPRDLKLISLALPVLLITVLTAPKLAIPRLAPKSVGEVPVQFQKVMADRWRNLNDSISDRAGIAYSDDFRSGLDEWESRSNLTGTWSYDATGFVRPGPLAIFKPTVDLTDYRLEFLGEIDRKAMGWVFRARDLDNYYAVKFVVAKPGPLPLVHIVRYAVMNGKEGPRVEKPLPLTVQADMLYRVQVNVLGGDFTIMAQGQVVDFWSDSRLTRGGVGFFCNRGESARLRWMEVSHQYDALGRLCAYLAPYPMEGRNGDIN